MGETKGSGLFVYSVRRAKQRVLTPLFTREVPGSGDDSYWGVEGESVVEFYDVVVVEGDAAECTGPVFSLTVDHDRTTEFRLPGRFAIVLYGLGDGVVLGGGDESVAAAPLGVFEIRIAQAHRTGVLRLPLGLANTDVEVALGRLEIAFALFVADNGAGGHSV